MSREEDKERLLQAIREAHDNSKLDLDIQGILIEAIKGLKRGELPSYVSYKLVRSLSGYFILHLREKQNPYVTNIYNIANELQRKYSAFLFY